MHCPNCSKNENPNAKIVFKDNKAWRIRKCVACDWQDIEDITTDSQEKLEWDSGPKKKDIRDHLKDIL